MATKRALIFGSRGALGSALVNSFKARGNWFTVGVDLKANENANFSIEVDANGSMSQQSKEIQAKIRQQQQQGAAAAAAAEWKFDAVICLAGGFAMGHLKNSDFIETCDMMWKVSVQSSIISAQLASQYLTDAGLLVLPGAAGATQPTPQMIGYGMAKCAVHHLVRSVANQKESGMPLHSTTIGLMPSILDTESNRRAMPKANYENWTPLDELADKIIDWCEEPAHRPNNGSLVRIITKNSQTTFVEEEKIIIQT